MFTAVCAAEQGRVEHTLQEKSSPAGKCRPGHRRNVSDTSANAISLPGHQSAFQLVSEACVLLLAVYLTFLCG